MTDMQSNEKVLVRSRRTAMCGAAVSEAAFALVIFAIVAVLFLRGGILNGFSASERRTDAEAALASAGAAIPPLIDVLPDGSLQAAENFEDGLSSLARQIESNARSSTCASLSAVTRTGDCNPSGISVAPYEEGGTASFTSNGSDCDANWTAAAGSITASIKDKFQAQGCPGVKHYATAAVFYDEGDPSKVEVASFESGKSEVVAGLPGGSGGPGGGGDPPGGGTCFAAITPVLMADGTFKEIQYLRPGDLVLATDDVDTTRPRVPARVAQVDVYYQREVLVLKAGGEYIATTPEHPFYVANADVWLPAALLKHGDLLTHADGQLSMVDEVGATWGKMNVYNVQLEGPHTYFVGKSAILTHNVSGSGGGPQQFSGSEIEVTGKDPANGSISGSMGGGSFQQ